MNIKSVGVFTSGGDSPGMNAAIRAVVRTAIYKKLKVYGIMRGYEGMINGEIIPMQSTSVSNIIQKGGTILKSFRSEKFKNPKHRKTAFEQLKRFGIDSLVAIGGDGTFTGASVFHNEFKIPIVGIPGTIDNDLYGTDFTVGYDTAINTATDAIDKIRDTADSHDRLFIIEVMGRDAGFIALRCGIAGGAEAILIPESKGDFEKALKILEKGRQRKKTSSIIVVAEGDEEGGAFKVSRKIKAKFPRYSIRVSILGHIQRGGKPTCMDRVLASKLGVGAIEALLNGKTNVMIGINHQDIAFTPFEKAVKHFTHFNSNLMRIAEILSL